MNCRFLSALSCVSLVVGLLLPTAGLAGDFEADRYSDIGGMKRDILASHFLTRTTFGPTEADVDALSLRISQIGKKAAFAEWIDDQFSDYPISSNPETYQVDRGRIWPLAKKMLQDMGYRASNFDEDQGNDQGVYNRNQWKEHAWWHRALTGKDQLRQRMAWALSQIFVVGEGPAPFQNQNFDTTANPRWLSLARYYDDVCIANAFGNYRDLLDSMTYHPVMGLWLTTVQNTKANPSTGSFPDENYAREIMQLFSIGLVELKTNGEARVGPGGDFVETYDNETISALARVFTGLVYNNNNNNNDSFGAGINFHREMDLYEQEHDTGQKVCFNGRLVVPARGQSENNMRQDIADVHDFFAFEHRNTAPFICRQLIQRFVMSNPPKSYLRRVAKVWNSNKTNPNQFEEVIKAILLDKVALNALKFKRTNSPPGLSVVRKYPTERTRLREPVLRYTALLRAFSPYPDPSFLTNGSKVPYYTPGGAEGAAGNQYYFIDNGSSSLNSDIAQAPFESPSVFNFYLPDYQPPGLISNYVPSKNVINGKLVTPEFQIISPVTANETMNEMRTTMIDSDLDIGNQWEVDSLVNLDVNLDLEKYYGNGGLLGQANIEPNLSQLKDFIEDLDMTLCAGTMSQSTKQTLIDVCVAEFSSYDVNTVTEKEDLVQAVITAVLVSPDCAVMP